MESSDRKNVYLAKTGDNSLNSAMRDTMIVGQTNMAPGIEMENGSPSFHQTFARV